MIKTILSILLIDMLFVNDYEDGKLSFFCEKYYKI